jgi:M6 family metalloprotease-like protein
MRTWGWTTQWTIRVCSGFVLALPMSGTILADYVAGAVYPLRQPDGTTIDVRIWGDEFYHVVESLDGYTLVRDEQTGFGCYARRSPDGNEFISTGVPVGSPRFATLRLQPHLRLNPEAVRARVAEARARLEEEKADVLGALGRNVEPAPPTLGQVQGITLLVDFDDQPAVIPAAEIDNYCNQVGYSGYGNNGSVRDYFYDVSDGHLAYTNFVPDGYYRAVETKSWYDNSSVPCCSRARSLVLEALNDLDDQGFDFSQYDSNGDGLIDAVNVFYAGTRNGPWTYGLWPHSGWISFSADGVSTGRYQITDIGNELRLRTFCHENGHMVGYWPDLYDYGYESAGVGNFCLMCYGASDTNPAEPSAYMKYLAGWADIMPLVAPQSGVSATAGVNTIYKFDNPYAANEYYLIENRQRTERDAAIPDDGLAIWHVDEFGNNDWEQMTPDYHYEVTLVQADGDWDLEYFRNYGDSTDLYAAPAYTECTPETDPNTGWWDGTASTLFVTDISTSGPTMTFTFRNSGDCNNNGIPDDEDVISGFSPDTNGNGIPDECECAVIADRPQPEQPVAVAKSRSISFTPGNAGHMTAVRVKFVDLPAPYNVLNGETMFLGAPQETCENAGQSTPPPEGCGAAPGAPSPTFQAATLQCDPYYADWGPIGTIHVFHQAIVPGGVYEIQAIDQTCNAGAETVYSTSFWAETTSVWGDLVEDCTANPCGPPDGIVGVTTDVTSVLDKFKNLYGAPTKARCEMEPASPDLAINIADVTQVLEAFKGSGYPFVDVPSACPPPLD